eukprot:1458523-Pyramimonas_sp.AAC.1
MPGPRHQAYRSNTNSCTETMPLGYGLNHVPSVSDCDCVSNNTSSRFPFLLFRPSSIPVLIQGSPILNTHRPHPTPATPNNSVTPRVHPAGSGQPTDSSARPLTTHARCSNTPHYSKLRLL